MTARRKAEPNLSYTEAVDEVVANGCEMMLQDSKAIRELCEANRTLGERIGDFLRDFVQSLREAFGGQAAHSPEAQILMQYAEELQQLWDEGFKAAVENRRAGKKNTAPKGGVKYAKDSEESKKIKQQLKGYEEKLNTMEPVFSKTGIKAKNTHDTYLEAIEEFRKIGYHVDRPGFGIIKFDAKRTNTALDYANTAAERAAVLAVPRVLKRGIEIKEASEHKSRGHDTVTFAGPVVLNGK